MSGTDPQAKPPPHRPRRIALLTAAALLAGCASGNLGDNVGVRVDGEASSINLAWDANHPWAAQFQNQASRFHLYAQYRSGGQAVEQDIGAARLLAQGNWSFQLPLSLRRVPDGQVCLFVSGSRTSASIPVRTPSANNPDTARFRYPSWETVVLSSTQTALEQRETSNMEASVAELEAEANRQRDSLQKAGIRSPEDCQRLAAAAAPANPDTLPMDVLAPSKQAEGAQHVCVRRAREMRRLKPEYRVDVVDFVSKISSESAPATDRLKPMAAQFQQHWTRWYERSGPEYIPEAGNPGDWLPTVGVLDESIRTWNTNASSRTPELRRVIAAGLLDGYAGCLEDVGKQLKVKYESWQKAQTNKPMRDRLYAERQQAVCVSRLNELGKLNVALGEAQAQVSAKRGQAGKPTGGAPSASKTPLNGQSCTI